MDKSDAFILWFDQLGIEDVPLVGGKNASLGEMYRELAEKGVKVPNGFAVTAYAYHYLLDKNNAREKVKEILSDLNTHDMKNLAERGHKVRTLIRNLEFPTELRDAIHEAYRHMAKEYGENTDVAVRSSATAEDLPDASFAGQQETYLNVHGEDMLIDACKKCFASLFTNRAISYRQDKGFDHFSIGLSIGVQKMVRSDLATSGVMFSIDTESGFENVVFITGAYGLGENVVQGAVNPDEYYVFKPTLHNNFRPIISKEVGSKEKKMIYDEHGNKAVKNVPVPPEEQKKFCLSDDETLLLAKWAIIIEEHYSKKAGHFKPMDMEWAKDGKSGDMFIVQARPETVHSQKAKNVYSTYHLDAPDKKILVTGHSVGKRIGQGHVNVIKDVKGIGDFQEGAVLVTEMTDPDWEPIMKKAAAIVTNSGGRTCHAAIISRELGIPCVVGSENATEVLKNNQEVTVDCSQGDEGYVYDGKIHFEIEETNLDTMPETKTKVMMIVGTPEQAFEFSRIPNQGCGLARMEFIINSYIRIHPLALIDYPNVEPDVKKKIDELTFGYDDKKEYFIDRLAHGMGRIAAAFYPKTVIVRMSDFKTNEYANLIGGHKYEPKEDNPMIGWRGASRYYDEKYAPGFALECAALKRVREEFGLTNLIAMIPFCRTLDEAHKCVDTMAAHGLKQGENGFQIYGMCEIPSNVLLAEEFLDIFDGMSIGSNDLTQLTLGLDRDSGMLAHIGNERNEAVKKLIAMVIDVANKKGKYIGICGQGPSDFPDFAEFLVEKGIQSIALNPDTVIATTLTIAEKEKQLGK
ncbi:phosphoenolpyruvate synthase [Candidatus Woesearchaeota archaeon]|nr:phosphoenolpyruvate synthase [Candidatus Woesearchaeota archaeon]